MCSGCATHHPHDTRHCLFPQSCTCQHRLPVTGALEIGREREPTSGSPLTIQEQNRNATDRLDT